MEELTSPQTGAKEGFAVMPLSKRFELRKKKKEEEEGGE
jgi:hypothetical protein